MIGLSLTPLRSNNQSKMPLQHKEQPMTTRISVKLFQQVAAHLLQKAYGLTLNDTRLCEDSFVALCITNGLRPFQELSEHARDADLDRIDLPAVYGAPEKSDLTAADEREALACVKGVQLLGDELARPFVIPCGT